MKKSLLIILCLLLCYALCACGAEEIVWDNIILGDKLPTPPVNKGQIYTNTPDNLWVSIEGISDVQHVDYLNLCKEYGFTIDAYSSSISYEAFNAEGYELRIEYYNSNSKLSIHLDSPMEMSTIDWPSGIAGQQLPIPKSTTGKFSHEYDDHFFVYIGNTTKADYADYVDNCSQMGFNVDYNKGDDYYYADNEDGWHISLRYEGNNIMSIDIDAPKNDSNSSETTIPATEELTDPNVTEEVAEKNNNNSGLDPDFKAAMDSYEEFMDEYIAFMKKYKDDPYNLSLLTDYADYMSQYTDFVEDFDKWENEDMNAAETAYYIEVQTRVNKKLLEVAS